MSTATATPAKEEKAAPERWQTAFDLFPAIKADKQEAKEEFASLMLPFIRSLARHRAALYAPDAGCDLDSESLTSAAQEKLTKLIANKSFVHMQSPSALMHWMTRVMLNVFAKEKERFFSQKHTPHRATSIDDGHMPEVAGSCTTDLLETRIADLSGQIKDILTQRLPQNYSSAMALVIDDPDAPNPTHAASLGIPSGRFRVHLTRAREAIMKDPDLTREIEQALDGIAIVRTCSPGR